MRQAGCCRKEKYYELKEANQETGSTSILSVPIPAVRAYDSAWIPGMDSSHVTDPSADPQTRSCSVLHNMNGAIGVVTFGLMTEDIALSTRWAQLAQISTVANAHADSLWGLSLQTYTIIRQAVPHVQPWSVLLL